MSAIGLMNQTLGVYPKSSYGADGREVFGSLASVRARAQLKAKRVLLPNGSVITIDGTVYVPADTVVDTDYKVVYASITYKVVSKYAVPGGNGNTDHIKLEIVKWQ